MAISVKLLRTGTNTTQNTFVVTAGSGDSGKLQIQYNDSDIYNNLSGSTSDILSGASNTTITIPLDSNENIQKGKYYFNFVADVGSSDTHTINFQIDARDPVLASEADVYAPDHSRSHLKNIKRTGRKPASSEITKKITVKKSEDVKEYYRQYQWLKRNPEAEHCPPRKLKN